MKIFFRTKIFITLFALVLSSDIALSYAGQIPYFLKEVVSNKTALSRPSKENGKTLNVSADFSVINPQSKTEQIKVMIPGNTVILKKIKTIKRSESNYSWFGKVSGGKFSSAVLTVVNNRMSGRIDSEGRTYHINPDAKNYVVTESDPSLMGPLKNDVLVPPSKAKESKVIPLNTGNLQDDGSKLDILILYTQAMNDRYGDDLDSMIQNFVDQANQAYSDSLITTSISLVHTELYTNADEVVTISLALNTLTNDPAVTTLRNSYRADLVSFLRVYDGFSSCGFAWIMTKVDSSFSDNAFSVIEVRNSDEAGSGEYYCDTLSFAHEIGHNLGCHHDRSSLSNPSNQGAFDYSYGYDNQEAKIPSPVFATIMSYDDGRIPYFSNPLVFIDGAAIGKDENMPDSADNAKTINNTKVTAANFRTGEDKNISISPVFYNFGNVKLAEDPKTRTFSISNSALSDITINNAVISGTDSTEFSIITDTCSSSTISPSQSCTIDISFSPASEGEKSSFLSIVYNGLTESPVTASISGNAVLCGTSPSISKVTKNKSSYGNTLTISGADFCTDPGKILFTKSGETIELSLFDSWKDDEIIFKVPWRIKAGKNKIKAVTNTGLESNGKNFTLIKPLPEIIKINPKKGTALSQITVSGSNFGLNDKKSKVSFNSANASVITWTNELLTVEVPDVNLKKKKSKKCRVKVNTYYGKSNSKKFKVLKSTGG